MRFEDADSGCQACALRALTTQLTLGCRHGAGDAGGGQAARCRHAGAVHSGIVGTRPLQRQQAAVVYASRYGKRRADYACVVSLGWVSAGKQGCAAACEADQHGRHNLLRKP